MCAMTERADREAPEPGPGPGPGGAAEGAAGGAGPTAEELASSELAALYIQQGEYERGIAMYRRLLVADPADGELKERLNDAEALADLLILRPPKAQFQAGYQEGYRRGMAHRGALTGEERIARLTAWLDRVKDRP
jgi:tetratricopeptide (TPR) repeat protein